MGILSGWVVDKNTQKYIKGVSITLGNNKISFSNSDGYFSMNFDNSLVTDKSEVRAVYRGYETVLLNLGDITGKTGAFIIEMVGIGSVGSVPIAMGTDPSESPSDIQNVRTNIEIPIMADMGANAITHSEIDQTFTVYSKNPDELKNSLPEYISGYKVNVEYKGDIKLLADPCNRCYDPPQGVCDYTRVTRTRPSVGGMSIGSPYCSGTITCAVSSKIDPSQKFFLSNQHVLRDGGNGALTRVKGDCVLQPGKADGGNYPEDKIGVIDSWVDLIVYDVNGNLYSNLIDATLAKPVIDNYIRSGVLDENGYIIPLRGVNYLTSRNIDSNKPSTWLYGCKKYGRTTGYTKGAITNDNISITVWYNLDGGGYRPIYLTNQYEINMLVCSGDSGSLLLDGDNSAVGLIFASDSDYGIPAYANKIKNVTDLLGVDIIVDGSIEDLYPIEFVGPVQSYPTTQTTYICKITNNSSYSNYIRVNFLVKDLSGNLIKEVSAGNSIYIKSKEVLPINVSIGILPEGSYSICANIRVM